MKKLHQCKNKGLRQKCSLSGSASSCSGCMLPKSILAEIVTRCRQEALRTTLVHVFGYIILCYKVEPACMHIPFINNRL